MRKRVLSAFAAITLAVGPLQAEDLMDIYELALESDPQLRAAEAAYRAAQEARPQSRAALLPQLNANANWSRNWTDIDEHSFGPSYTGSSDYNTHSYGLSLTQAVYHRDYFVQLRQADATIAQATAEVGAARQGLVLRVAEAYFNVLAARDNLTFAQAEKEAVSQQLRQTEQRFEVGLTAITDVHEAQARYDLSVAQEIAAQNQLDTAREALIEIIGREYDSLAPLSEQMPLVNPEPADIDRWVQTAMDENLQLEAARAAEQVAQEEINRRESGHYPNVDLVAQHTYSDTLDAAFGARQDDTSLSLQFNLPLYSGGLTSSQVRESRAQYTRAQEQLEQTRRATTRSTRAAYLNIASGISQVKALKQSLASTQTALEATEAGYEVGTRTAVDVLNAQRERFKAERDYARARYDYILATLRLKQAAGTLTRDDLRKIGGWLK